MSYNLLVFDPKFAPRDRDAFMAWYVNLTKWGEERDYNSPDGVTGNLRSFYEALISTFPPMNGPDAYDLDAPEHIQITKKTGLLGKIFGRKIDQTNSNIEFNEAFITDYCIAENAIYLAFAWSVEEEAYRRVVATALASGVGFFDVSADNGAILHERSQFDEFITL